MQIVDPLCLLENILQFKDLPKVRHRNAATHIIACALNYCLVFNNSNINVEVRNRVNSPSPDDNRHDHVVIKPYCQIQIWH
jgi:hypothetical protein